MKVLPRGPAVTGTALVSAMTCPSSISMRRRVRAATAWSWVMMTTVVPGRVEFFQQGQDGRAGGRVEVAGGLVGQQQRRRGPRWPGRSRPAAARRRTAGSAGRRPGARARPGPARRRPAAAARRGAPRRRAARRPRCPARVWCSARKNCWNTNPIREARSADSSRSRHPGHVQPGDPHRAAGRLVQGAHQVQQRGLARPGRADDRRPVPRPPPPGSPGRAPAPAAAPGTPSTPRPVPAPALRPARPAGQAVPSGHDAATTTRWPGGQRPGHLHQAGGVVEDRAGRHRHPAPRVPRPTTSTT